MTFFYLGLAFFYPETCDPRGLQGNYVTAQSNEWVGDVISLEQDIVSLQASTATYIVSPSSSNISWRLDSSLKALLSLDFSLAINVQTPWVEYAPQTLFALAAVNQPSHQIETSPPDQPPQFLAWL